MTPKLSQLAYGGGYYPEQWPEAVWAEDVQLMKRAGVNLVTVGLYSWAMLQPGHGTYTFDWLDRVLALLNEHGIRVNLATATGSPPPWFTRLHPESRPVTAEGDILVAGARQHFCPKTTP